MFKPANKSTLYEDVLKQILEAVKNGRWNPGEKIPGELSLAEKFQVSRNCIREALKALSILNIIEARPGQGTFISEDALCQITNRELTEHLSEKVSVMELMEIRIMLETQTVLWAIERASDDELERLKAIIEKERQFGRDLSKSSLQPRAEFHRILAEIAGNSLAVKFLNSIREELNAQRHRYLDLPLDTWEGLMNEHELILDLISRRDPVKAVKVMKDHVLRMKEVLNTGE